jgi:integrase
MPRPRIWPPIPHPHKASGQERLRVDGQDILLGPIGSAEAKQAYAAWIVKLAANGGRIPNASVQPTIESFLELFWVHAETHYAKAPNELLQYKHALRALRFLHGGKTLAEFSPRHLIEVRDLMARGYKHPEHGEVSKWTRKVVNRQLVRIRTAFGWGVFEGVVSGDLFARLKLVRGFRKGTPDVEDPGDVLPAPEDDVASTLRQLGPWIRAMVNTQLLTACRPCEVVRFCPVDFVGIEQIDLGKGIKVKTPGVWAWSPQKHKTSHHGHARIVLFGPRCQKMLRPFLKDRRPDAPLFSPREATEFYLRWNDRLIRHSPKRVPGEQYTVASYGKAIAAACERAEVPTWSPGQLRHNAATRLVEQFGWEIARVVLGHQKIETTKIYALENFRKAADAIKLIG